MDEKWEIISALDLRSVNAKFRSRKGFWWFLRHNPARIEREYRQFLYLIATNPDHTVVPWSQEIDDFWHEHILDTAKYAKDCQTINGNFIHHNPHLPKGTLNHTRAFTETQKLYRAAFKEKAKKRRGSAECSAGCTYGMPVVFCASDTTHHGSHASGHHGGDASHAGGHHSGDAGHSHGCGGHGGGHGCGGHGCGGHGCGGHG